MSQNKKKQTAPQKSGTKQLNKSAPKKSASAPSNGSESDSTTEPKQSPAPDPQETTQEAPQTDEQGQGGTDTQDGTDNPAEGLTWPEGWGVIQDEDSGVYTAEGPDDDGEPQVYTSMDLTELNQQVNASFKQDTNEDNGAPPSGDSAGGTSTDSNEPITIEQTKGDTSPGPNEGKPIDENTAKVSWGGLPEEAEPDGLILDPDEPVRFEGDHEGNMVRVSRDVYRKVYPRGTNKPTYILLYKKNALISGQQAQQV